MDKFHFTTVNDGSFVSIAMMLKELSDAKLRLAVVTTGMAEVREWAYFGPGEHFVSTDGSVIVYDIDPTIFQPVLEMLGVEKLQNRRGFFTDEMFVLAVRRDKIDNAVANGEVLSIEDGVARHCFPLEDMQWAAERHAAFLDK